MKRRRFPISSDELSRLAAACPFFIARRDAAFRPATYCSSRQIPLQPASSRYSDI